MRQLSQPILQPEKMVLEKQNEAKRQTEFQGRIRLHKGQKFYELNCATGEINEIKIKKGVINLDGSITKEYDIKDWHWYEVAINIKNVERKFLNKAKNLKIMISVTQQPKPVANPKPGGPSSTKGKTMHPSMPPNPKPGKPC